MYSLSLELKESVCTMLQCCSIDLLLGKGTSTGGSNIAGMFQLILPGDTVPVGVIAGKVNNVVVSQLERPLPLSFSIKTLADSRTSTKP